MAAVSRLDLSRSIVFLRAVVRMVLSVDLDFLATEGGEGDV